MVQLVKVPATKLKTLAPMILWSYDLNMVAEGPLQQLDS